MPALAFISCPETLHSSLSELLSYWPELSIVELDTASLPTGVVVPRPDLLTTEELDLLRDISCPVLILGNLPTDLNSHRNITSIPLPLHWSGFAAQIDQLIRGRDALEPFGCGPFVCVPLDHSLIDKAGEEIARLTDKEITLLRCLARAGEAGVERDELLRNVWGYQADGLDTHTLETHIYRLRQKMEPDPAAPIFLLTVERGYAVAPLSTDGKDT